MQFRLKKFAAGEEIEGKMSHPPPYLIVRPCSGKEQAMLGTSFLMRNNWAQGRLTAPAAAQKMGP
jgi:hypothetical protein